MADPTVKITQESENRALLEVMEKKLHAGAFVMTRTGAMLNEGEQREGSIAVADVPKDRVLQSLKPFIDEYRDKPERIVGCSFHASLPSFIKHVERFKDAGSALFADFRDPSKPALKAVYDYHQGAGQPRFGKHVAVYQFPLSEEWRAWNAAFSQAAMNQAEFAQLIEDRMMDIASPESAGITAEPLANLGLQLASPQKMLQLSQGLALTVDQRVAQSVKLGNGSGSIRFEEEHKDEAGAPLTVPGAFVIAIPVFTDDTPFMIAVRLRYKVQGRITWSMVPHRLSKVFDVATREVATKAELATNLPLFYGSPEHGQ